MTLKKEDISALLDKHLDEFGKTVTAEVKEIVNTNDRKTKAFVVKEVKSLISHVNKTLKEYYDERDVYFNKQCEEVIGQMKDLLRTMKEKND